MIDIRCHRHVGTFKACMVFPTSNLIIIIISMLSVVIIIMLSAFGGMQQRCSGMLREAENRIPSGINLLHVYVP